MSDLNAVKMGRKMQFNKTEMRVYGLQRSGNHAIINWIAAQSTGACLVLNDCTPGANPFDTMQGYCEYSDGNVVSLHDTWDDEARYLASLGAPSERNIFIHSYEDRALSNFSSPESWIGGSNAYFNVLIVRDPLNFFASRLRIWNELSGLKDRRVVVELWKDYAREALGLTACLDPAHTVVINFTRWKADVEYRKTLSARFGLTFSDQGMESMVRIGPGSSFDKFSLSSQASKMMVNERWRSAMQDADFRSIVSDTELRELSLGFFGPQDGWTEILQS
jgi:hypothetical protein